MQKRKKKQENSTTRRKKVRNYKTTEDAPLDNIDDISSATTTVRPDSWFTDDVGK